MYVGSKTVISELCTVVKDRHFRAVYVGTKTVISELCTVVKDRHFRVVDC